MTEADSFYSSSKLDFISDLYNGGYFHILERIVLLLPIPAIRAFKNVYPGNSDVNFVLGSNTLYSFVQISRSLKYLMKGDIELLILSFTDIPVKGNSQL